MYVKTPSIVLVAQSPVHKSATMIMGRIHDTADKKWLSDSTMQIQENVQWTTWL